MTGYICKSCGSPSPTGVGDPLTSSTPADERASTDRIACDCGQSVATAPWAVLNCPATRVLGLYSTEARAAEAAQNFGSCSFHYPLSAAEAAAMLSTRPE